MAENNSSGDSFDTSAFVMSNSVRSRSRSRTACLPGEEGLDGDGKLAGDPLQECQFGWTGIDTAPGAEAERAEPIIAGSEGDEGHRGTDPEARERVVRTPASESRTRDVEITSGCWFSHTQPAGS